MCQPLRSEILSEQHHKIQSLRSQRIMARLKMTVGRERLTSSQKRRRSTHHDGDAASQKAVCTEADENHNRQIPKNENDSIGKLLLLQHADKPELSIN